MRGKRLTIEWIAPNGVRLVRIENLDTLTARSLVDMYANVPWQIAARPSK